MTENEAIRVLKNGWHFAILLEDKQLIDIAIQALEEIQQYRAIGTIEELETYKNGDCMNKCEHYDNCANYIYSKGYNKAIDDFVDKARPFMDTHHDFIMIHKVAELMKIEEDRENGDNRKLLHETGNGQ